MNGEITDAEHHMNSLSFPAYLDSLQYTDDLSPPERIPPSPGMDSNAETVLAIEPEPTCTSPSPFVRQLASRSHHTGSQLLAKNAGGTRKSAMAAVSEVHLDASAGGCNFVLLPQAALDRGDRISHSTGVELIQHLLAWLKSIGHATGPDASPTLQSAEERLRAMLGADDQESTHSAVS